MARYFEIKAVTERQVKPSTETRHKNLKKQIEIHMANAKTKRTGY